MKQYILFLFGLLSSIILWSQPASDIRRLNSSAGLSSEESACQSFILGHGFSLSSSSQSLKLNINSSVCAPAFNQTNITNGQNYIITVTPLDETKSIQINNGTIEVDRTLNSSPRYTTQIQYFDGLGRPNQTVLRNITPGGKDLVSLQEYDNFGRESRSWLPAPYAGNGAFVANAASEIYQYYNDSAYSHPIYESSPLNRVLEQYGPGKEWKTAKRSVKTEYLTNSTTYPCLIFNIGMNRLEKSTNYPEGELFVTRTSDEDGKNSFEFKDKLGQVVLTRQLDGNIKFDTYYVYDDFGNLRYVLPPLASDELIAGKSGEDNGVTMKKYAYLYQYDERNRCVMKRLPGCEPIYYVYDKADRLICSQDGVQRRANYWTINKYDKLGRSIIVGEQPSDYSHDQLRAMYKDVVVKEEMTSGGYYTSSSQLELLSEYIDVTSYYDNYDGLTKNNPKLVYEPKSDYGKKYDSAKGLLTGTRERPLDYSNDLLTVMYYDERGRIIQTRSNNYLGGYDFEYIAYNFTGQPIKKLHEHVLPSGKTITTPQGAVGTISIAYEYSYDQAGRLIKTTRNGEVLAQNEYDELGRVKKKNQGSNNAVSTTYDYNIRGWVSSINEENTGFYQRLFYQNGSGDKLYNGNIARMELGYTKTQGIYTKKPTYEFNMMYDGLNRMRQSIGYETAYDQGNEYSEVLTYDKHGNIQSLWRTQEGYHRDAFWFNYNGNQITNLSNEYPDHGGAAYTEYPEETSEFAYNENGSLTKDSGRGIVTIRYNKLNLPELVQFRNGNQIHYVYSASGQKLRTQHITAKQGVVQPIADGKTAILRPNDILSRLTTDYIGNFIYEDGQLDKILFEGGYSQCDYRGDTKTLYTMSHFYQQDHLGNNRNVVNALGSATQRTGYHPFGTPFKEPGTGQEENLQRYKYSGKEFDEMHGLNMYDFHARQHDPLLGSFTSMDPLAEKYYSWSPYAYCANNPLRYVDPDGTDWGETLEKLKQAAASIIEGIQASMGLHYNQLNTEEGGAASQAIRDEAETRRKKTAETINSVNTVMSTVTPIGAVAEVAAKGSEGDVSGVLAAAPLAVLDGATAGKGSNAIKAAKIASKGKTTLNFSKAAAKHMDEAGRYVPVQILDDVVKTTKGVPDPKGSRALMHTTEMIKHGKTYNLDVLYDKKTNSVWHFQYSPKKP